MIGEEVSTGVETGWPITATNIYISSDGLNRLLTNAVAQGVIKGLSGSTKSSVVNLQYADDTLLLKNLDIKKVI